MYCEPEAGAESHEIRPWARLPAVAAWTADGGALTLSLDDFGGVGLGNAARRGSDLGSAGDDVGVVGPGLGDHSASLTPGGLGDSGITAGDAGLSGHVWLGLGDNCGAGLNIVHQHGSSDNSHLGSFWNAMLVLIKGSVWMAA